jgi:chemotaxis-related protein WspB
MLFLLLQLGADRYALDASQITEILPLVGVKKIPQAPAGVAGLFDFRGTPVPVVDLSELILGRAAEQRLSTRIILVRYPGDDGGVRLLGLIAEKVTDTMRREPADFVDAGVNNDRAPYLGPVINDGRGLVQRIEVATLLPAPVRDVLFRPMVKS